MRRARYSPERGFTLLEVLVALAIVTIALAGVIRGVGSHLGNAVHLQEKTLAHWVALNKMTELKLAAQWPKEGFSDGSAKMAGREWFWTVKIADTPDPDIRRADVDIFPSAERTQRVATLAGYLGRPATAGGGS